MGALDGLRADRRSQETWKPACRRDLDERDRRLAEKNLATLKGFLGARSRRQVAPGGHFISAPSPLEILGGDKVEALRIERTCVEAGRAHRHRRDLGLALRCGHHRHRLSRAGHVRACALRREGAAPSCTTTVESRRASMRSAGASVGRPGSSAPTRRTATRRHSRSSRTSAAEYRQAGRRAAARSRCSPNAASAISTIPSGSGSRRRKSRRPQPQAPPRRKLVTIGDMLALCSMKIGLAQPPLVSK